MSTASQVPNDKESQSESETRITVESLPHNDQKSSFAAIPFALALPSSLTMTGPCAANDHSGIVGSIVFMGNKSAMIWVGWGQLLTNTRTSKDGNSNTGFGKGTPTMGQLVVAMPRTNYKGAFGTTGTNEASCSQIIGSDSSEDQMLANQMASRLSTRSGMAIYVSCQLSSSASSVPSAGAATNDLQDSWSMGLDSELVSHRAAALAEKEIWKILQTQIKSTTTM